ncbi:MAG: NAD(P)/FAD-dependent oxidoreductase [bacterium]
MEARDVVIIGAGPAGIAAAIQLRRQEISPVVFEQDEVGGLLRNAYMVENYPGFPEGIAGPELVALMRDHLGRNDVEVRRERAVSLDYREDRYLLRTAGGGTICRVAVVASGTEPRKIPDLAIPDDIMDRVFYEVYPIRDVRDKNIAIVGAGDAAFDYALNLSRQNEVTVLARSAAPRCNHRLWEKAASSLHISLMTGIEVRKAVGRGGKLLLSCSHLRRPGETTVSVGYLVIAVGREPATHFFTRGLAEQSAYLTLRNKLHLIGDVRNGLYRQASISVGNGVEAAMHIAKHLRSEGRINQ